MVMPRRLGHGKLVCGRLTMLNSFMFCSMLDAVHGKTIKDDLPWNMCLSCRFGHTTTFVGDNRVVLFGGATGDSGRSPSH